MGIKKILIVSTKEPFINGGDSVLINSLAQELSKNFEVEKILIPFSTNSDLIEEQIDGIRKLKFNYGDLVITSKPLSYAIKHPNKIVWFMHHLRHFYELWDTEFNPLKKEKDKFSELRKKIIEYDNKFLRECRKIFAISENVRKRLKEYNNLSSETIYPPISNPEKFKCHQYKDYFFYPSRITSNKRQHLVIEALKYTKGKYKLILAGQVDDKYFNKKIRPLLDNPNIKERIEILGYIDEEKKIDLYSDCLGVIFTPFDEDYGYITIESFYSSKMVI
ncbi:MAG: glycosyltransferase family 4 protein, partial [Candidatus Calescibacterium sp.]|nr:glycosyltransferase family 4 protein [Candidatus Calescibacterium sp.]MDW8132180.1 glycosyltransferase family 4 protein [Candidatus Calescibacterium sp.]